METVKLHRKHAYSKLEVSSQAELFYLFLDSVMSTSNYDGGDPLLPYQAGGEPLVNTRVPGYHRAGTGHCTGIMPDWHACRETPAPAMRPPAL